MRILMHHIVHSKKRDPDRKRKILELLVRANSEHQRLRGLLAVMSPQYVKFGMLTRRRKLLKRDREIDGMNP